MPLASYFLVLFLDFFSRFAFFLDSTNTSLNFFGESSHVTWGQSCVGSCMRSKTRNPPRIRHPLL